MSHEGEDFLGLLIIENIHVSIPVSVVWPVSAFWHGMVVLAHALSAFDWSASRLLSCWPKLKWFHNVEISVSNVRFINVKSRENIDRLSYMSILKSESIFTYLVRIFRLGRPYAFREMSRCEAYNDGGEYHTFNGL